MNRDSSSNCINAIYFSVPITLSAYPNFIAFVEPTVYVDFPFTGFLVVSAITLSGNLTDPNLSYTWCLPNPPITLTVNPISDKYCYANITAIFTPAIPVGNPSICDDLSTITYKLYN